MDRAFLEQPVKRRSDREDERKDLGEYLQASLRILQLDRDAIRAVSRDEEALLPAILFFTVAGVASGVAQFSIRSVILNALMMALLSFVVTGLLHVIARVFGSTASFLEIYRPLGVAGTIHWVQVVPFLGPFLGVLAVLYSLVVAAAVLETAGRLPRPKALVVVGLLAGVCLFLCLVFLALVGSLLLLRAVLG